MRYVVETEHINITIIDYIIPKCYCNEEEYLISAGCSCKDSNGNKIIRHIYMYFIIYEKYQFYMVVIQINNNNEFLNIMNFKFLYIYFNFL